MIEIMKKISIGLVILSMLMACGNDDMMPDVPKEGPVQLASVSVGTHTRGALIDNNFVFGSGDQVMMTAMVDGSVICNTFTYDGNKWTQDTPTGRYSTIYWQDDPAIRTIVSYGGKPVPPTTGMFLDQNSEGKYIAADRMEADPGRPIGSISITDDVVSARLAHDNSDLALKVYDGYDEKNVLAENTPVLKVIVDEDGSGADSKSLTFTAWNAGKASDGYGGFYTLFRVQLPAHCSILKAELSNVNETAGDLKTDILFRASDDQPSNEIDLESGRRYSASYTYDMLKTVATVNVSISPFEDNPEQDIIVTN